MKIAVVGTGAMGCGIALVCAQAGIDVVVYGQSEDAVHVATHNMEERVERMIINKRITREEGTKLLSQISTSLNLNACKGCSIVIERIAEDIERKKALFRQLDEICDPNTILVTNTMMLSVTALAAETKRPDKVIGFHFFNPIEESKLVEIGVNEVSDKEAIEKCKAFVERIGRKPMLVHEAPGYIVYRMLVPMINEAVAIFADGLASVNDIDSSMKLGANLTMGPLELADFIGLDVCITLLERLKKEFNNTKYAPHPMLVKMVKAGMLGRKSGEGFYIYS
ncbi:MAG: 3-hydroxyacyl-CoA dehydrogenase family protein [Marinifilaceae bacterium]